MLLQMLDPIEGVTCLLTLLQKFGCISGYKINLSKSLLFPLNDLVRQINYDHLPFKIKNEKFTYLGIVIASSVKALFKYNYKLMLERTENDLDR